MHLHTHAHITYTHTLVGAIGPNSAAAGCLRHTRTHAVRQRKGAADIYRVVSAIERPPQAIAQLMFYFPAFLDRPCHAFF